MSFRQIDIDLIRISRFQATSDAVKPTGEELRFAEQTAILTPVLVRAVGTSAFPSYELLGEEKSWFIAQQLMMPKVPAVVLDLPDEEARALIELRRRAKSEDPIQWAKQAEAFLANKRRYRPGYRIAEAARELGVERSRLSHALRLLKQLHPDLQDALSEGLIKVGHARRLASLPFAEQLRLARKIKTQGLSVRAVEAAVAERLLHGKARLVNELEKKPAYLTRLETQISEIVSADVSLEYDETTRSGELSLAFYSLEQLDGLLERLGWVADD
jgi:ParB family chromosome partitioning protein